MNPIVLLILIAPFSDNYFSLILTCREMRKIIYSSETFLSDKSKAYVLKQICKHGKLSLLQELINGGINLNIDNSIAIRIASSHGKALIVNHILNQKNIDIHANNNEAIISAVSNRYINIVRRLLSYGEYSREILLRLRNIAKMKGDAKMYIYLMTCI